MKIQVSFSLYKGQAQTFKSLVHNSLQSKVLRNYILNDFELPSDLSFLSKQEKGEVKVEKFLFDEDTDTRLTKLVADIKKEGFKANRSSLMRHIMQQLILKLEKSDSQYEGERERKFASFYFDKETLEVLGKYIPYGDRNAIIERFILEDYEPSSDQDELLKRPSEPKSVRIGIASEAFHRLDKFVEDIGVKGITRTALMRDAVLQLISKISKSDAKELIAERRLQNAVYEYEQTFGNETLKKRLKDIESEE
ncbi:hypothetical protein [Metabacillus fastidiosus]|uniref:hypothetical protein n=1 Tax=Metabacillus fastidiosus TaxID=1458 RepID=UPI002E1D9878|nr:hypothetical protein [Metabacillus fastidiosus]